MSNTDKDLRPGKGFHGDLTEEALNFFKTATEDIWNAVGDEEGSLDELIDSGDTKELLVFMENVYGSAAGWRKAKDKFGTKLFKAMDYGTGQYRVTLVVNNRGELKLDVRYWYDPDDANSFTYR